MNQRLPFKLGKVLLNRKPLKNENRGKKLQTSVPGKSHCAEKPKESYIIGKRLVSSKNREGLRRK